MSQAGRPASYHEYLRLDRILEAQRPPQFRSTDPNEDRDLIHHEEMLFIVMHQTMELWFKMMLADLSAARDLIGRPGAEDEEVPEEDIPRASTYLHRSAELFKHLTSSFTIIETMTPLQFLAFRDELIPASGFQSWQFRELEILAGLPEDERIDYLGKPYDAQMDEGPARKLEERRNEMSLREALLKWLARTPVERAFPGFVDTFLKAHDEYIDQQMARQLANPNLADEQRDGIIGEFGKAKAAAHAFFTPEDELERNAHQAFVFISTYRNEPLLRWPFAMLQKVLEFEEHFRLFRFRHARMVERMIGLRVGSGGSTGVRYLDSTASQYRIFGELLTATSYLIDESRLPASVPHPEILGFRISS